MDHHAKESRTTLQHHPHILPLIDRAHIRDNDGDITSNEKLMLETLWPTYRIEQYYLSRWQITPSDLQQMAWGTYEKNYQKAIPTIQKYIIKLITGWLPVHHHLNKITPAKNKCYLCQSEETIAHIYQCPHRHQWRQKLEEELLQQL